MTKTIKSFFSPFFLVVVALLVCGCAPLQGGGVYQGSRGVIGVQTAPPVVVRPPVYPPPVRIVCPPGTYFDGQVCRQRGLRQGCPHPMMYDRNFHRWICPINFFEENKGGSLEELEWVQLFTDPQGG